MGAGSEACGPGAPRGPAGSPPSLPFLWGAHLSPNRRGQGGGIGGSWVARPPSAPPPGRLAPPSTPAPAPGETLLSCPAPGLPASPAPGPERCSVQNRNPSPSRHPPPFRRTSTCPMFYLATRGVFSTGGAGRQRGAAEGAPGSPAGGAAGAASPSASLFDASRLSRLLSGPGRVSFRFLTGDR